MKLVKLSLAAIVAAGALTSVASAASLEEAIKNVDVTGYARYRFDSKSNTTGTTGLFGEVKKADSKNTHRFTSDVNFKAALDDNFFGVVGFRYDSQDVSGERVNAKTNVGTSDAGNDDKYGQTFNVRQFYLGYTAGNTTVTAGRQVLGTFFTDDMVGTGIKVLNSDISGLTLAAIAFDNLQADSDIGSATLLIGPTGTTNEYVYDRNLYGVAAIGSYDPVSFQVWYAALDSVAQLYALDVTVGANLGDVDLSLQAQYAGSSLWANNAQYEDPNKKGTFEVTKLDDAQFAAVEAGVKAYGFDANAGYVWFDTDSASLISFEDQGGFIDAGEDLLNYTAFIGENKYWFLTAGYTFDKVRVGADYVAGRIITTNEATDRYEAVARVDYKYSKKLNFKAWYSYINEDNENLDKDHFRFEARYNF
jgi:hypothetical protein